MQQKYRRDKCPYLTRAEGLGKTFNVIFNPSLKTILLRFLVPSSARVHEMPENVRKHCKKLDNASSKPIATGQAGKGQKPMEDDKRELYWALLNQHRKEYKIDNDESSQIITFLNRECSTLNEFGCWVYNNHLMFDPEERKRKRKFEIGDKVMVTKNADIPVYVPAEEEEDVQKVEEKEEFTSLNEAGSAWQDPDSLKLKTKNERLMNGSVFKIRGVCRHQVEKADKEENSNETVDDRSLAKAEGNVANSQPQNATVQVEYFVLDDMDGTIVRAHKDFIVKKCKLSHAWALSIHKFQGSEANSVVYGVSNNGFETWQHVYTAVTRGKKNMVIVGNNN